MIPKADTYLVPRENAIYCKRCGEKMGYTLPINVDVFVAMVKAFNKIHCNCKPKQEKEN